MSGLLEVSTNVVFTSTSMYTNLITRLTTSGVGNKSEQSQFDFANAIDFAATANTINSKMTQFEEKIFTSIFSTVIILGMYIIFKIKSFFFCVQSRYMQTRGTKASEKNICETFWKSLLYGRFKDKGEKRMGFSIISDFFKITFHIIYFKHLF